LDRSKLLATISMATMMLHGMLMSIPRNDDVVVVGVDGARLPCRSTTELQNGSLDWAKWTSLHGAAFLIAWRMYNSDYYLAAWTFPTGRKQLVLNKIVALAMM
jgi:hypothetical protein